MFVDKIKRSISKPPQIGHKVDIQKYIMIKHISLIPWHASVTQFFSSLSKTDILQLLMAWSFQLTPHANPPHRPLKKNYFKK
jgi:hypothetical protein